MKYLVLDRGSTVLSEEQRLTIPLVMCPVYCNKEVNIFLIAFEWVIC